MTLFATFVVVFPTWYVMTLLSEINNINAFRYLVINATLILLNCRYKPVTTVHKNYPYSI